MANLKNNIINQNIAGDTSNILIPDAAAIASGVGFKSNINSNVLNGYLNLLSEAVQYLQFTGGLYSEQADYNEGNIVSLVIKNAEDYSIWQFRRNANNPQVLNNNPPISGASITTENGVNVYEGGTLNTDWDKLTEDYAVEATPNTVMGRDSQGASNVNMPSGYIPDTTIVNHKYMVDTFAINNQYLEEKIQTGLDTKQDKLTAGTNVEITEDNVINVQGDVATAASQVTQTNEALGANVQTALDSLKTKDDDLQNQITVIVDEKLPDIYDYSGIETLTNKIAIVNGERKQVYRKCKKENYNFIMDSQFHELNAIIVSNAIFIASKVSVGISEDALLNVFTNGNHTVQGDFVRSFHYKGRAGFQYQLSNYNTLVYYSIEAEYYKI